MKRVLILATALSLVGGVAFAGQYHSGANLVCADCHTMHASLQHSYDPATITQDPFGAFPQTFVPTDYLLKSPDGTVSGMCLSCHNGTGFAPDVLANDFNLTNSGRSAGALNDLAGTDGYSTWDGHTIGSTDDPPGYQAGDNNYDLTGGLECVSCHHQHGFAGGGARDVAGATVSSAFRNLRGMSIDGTTRNVSYAITTNNLVRDVFIDTSFSEYTPGVINTYETDLINLNEPVTTDSGIATWCGGCHGDFHGADVTGTEYGGEAVGAAWEHFNRHPASTVNIGALTGGHSNINVYRNRLYRVRVMSATGVWGTQGQAWTTSPTDITPTCLSCHKGHGNNQPFGLIYALGAAPLGEDGDGPGARNLCKQCHVQGG